MIIDEIHDQFCAALTKAGAQPCEALIVDRQATRADAVFVDDRIIIEVKTVTIDRNKVDAIRKRSGQIWAEAIRNGGPVPFGTDSIPMDQMDAELANAFLHHLGDRVRKELRSANKQIRSTVNQLGFSDARGIVVIAVPAHFSLHAGFIASVAGRVLRPGAYSSIHGLIICSVPITGETQTNPLTFTYHPRSLNDAATNLPARIGRAWMDHLAENDGVPVTHEIGSPKQFEDIFLVGDEDWPKHGEQWKD
ncbi:hypothetical protein [Novosphingobium sp.]|uniref:hypothetical protein n=1 Tax=Novosphingobium sp. TaxID=1874826 RepID=UPI0025F36601|nr:hypothetical protein [Novosphingobium sp.]